MDIASLGLEMASATSSASKLILPVCLAGVALELGFIKFLRKAPYALREAGMSLAMGIAYARAAALAGLVWGWLYFLCYEYRLFTVPADAWWGPVLLFVLVDFCFYWQHRFAHVSRWGWASHLQHHSVEQLNMAAPFRLSVTSTISGFQAFYAPLALLGFHPVLIVVFVLLNVSLQMPLHTELVRKLWWPLEQVLNTPSHHRVHHAKNSIYLDKNLGGLFIVWDRLFGTFEPEDEAEPVVYGLTKNIRTHNPLTIASHEFRDILRDVADSETWTDRLSFVVRGPGWAYARRAEMDADPVLPDPEPAAAGVA